MDEFGKLHHLNDGMPIINDVENPSYLCILGRTRGGDGRIARRPSALRDGGLCVVSEVRKGRIRSYAVGRDAATRGGGSGDPTMRATASGGALDTGGSYPCHVAFAKVDDGDDDDNDAECIVVCNYGEEEGVLSVFTFGNGEMNPVPINIALGRGSNANPDRQGASHAHSTSISKLPSHPSSIDMCCADLGSDAIVRFTIGTNKSIADGGGLSLLCTEGERIHAPPGSGPRSITFNPVYGDIAIVSLEMTAQVWLIRRNASAGNYDALCDPISLLPEDWPSASDEIDKFNHGRWASDAVWSPCGRYAYAAARLHNSLTVFRLSTTADDSSSGSAAEYEPLRFVQRTSTNGLTPRCLCMSECGKFIIVAHQHSHDISSFGRDEYDGTISFIDRLEVPNAACVKLIRPDEIG